MAPKEQPRTRARIGFVSGPTYCTYTPDGTKLVTIGQNDYMRIYKSGSNDEPTNLDDAQGEKLGVTAAVSGLTSSQICLSWLTRTIERLLPHLRRARLHFKILDSGERLPGVPLDNHTSDP